MDEDELEIPKGSLLKQLNDEDLTVHSVDALKDRIVVLKSEISRTEKEIENKQGAKSAAESIFK